MVQGPRWALMSSKTVLRVPVDNDPDIEADGIPAVAKRMAAEGVGTASQAAVIRWAIRDAANPRRRSTTNAGIQNDVARSMVEELRADVAKLSSELAMANGRVVAAETMALTLRSELGTLVAASTQAAIGVDGARFKVAREATGLTQHELASRLGYSERSAVSLAERGRAPLSAKMVEWLKEQGR